MSKEHQQIVGLVDLLDQKEIQDLLDHLYLLQARKQDDTDIYISEEEKDLIRERFRMIDEGKSEMIHWEEVKRNVFKTD